MSARTEIAMTEVRTVSPNFRTHVIGYIHRCLKTCHGPIRQIPAISSSQEKSKAQDYLRPRGHHGAIDIRKDTTGSLQGPKVLDLNINGRRFVFTVTVIIAFSHRSPFCHAVTLFGQKRSHQKFYARICFYC
jgi:hypothetical protein